MGNLVILELGHSVLLQLFNVADVILHSIGHTLKIRRSIIIHTNQKINMIKISFIFVIGIVCFSYAQSKHVSPRGAIDPGNQKWDENGKANSDSFQTTRNTFPEHKNTMLTRSFRRKKFGMFYLHRPENNARNQHLLFLPMPIHHLKCQNFEALPNNDVCVNGERLPKALFMNLVMEWLLTED